MNEIKCAECGSRDGIEVYEYPVVEDGEDPTVHLCLECAPKVGFCSGCHHFWAGGDWTFDTRGICSDCLDALRYETGEYDDDDDGDWDWWHYNHDWYDPDADLHELEDSPVSIDIRLSTEQAAQACTELFKNTIDVGEYHRAMDVADRGLLTFETAVEWIRYVEGTRYSDDDLVELSLNGIRADELKTVIDNGTADFILEKDPLHELKVQYESFMYRVLGRLTVVIRWVDQMLRRVVR